MTSQHWIATVPAGAIASNAFALCDERAERIRACSCDDRLHVVNIGVPLEMRGTKKITDGSQKMKSNTELD